MFNRKTWLTAVVSLLATLGLIAGSIWLTAPEHKVITPAYAVPNGPVALSAAAHIKQVQIPSGNNIRSLNRTSPVKKKLHLTPKQWKDLLKLIKALNTPHPVLQSRHPYGLNDAQWALHIQPFLVCTRHHESASGGWPWPYDQNYHIQNFGGAPYYGAYQFGQSTWNNTARHIGATNLIGVNPMHASVVDQDRMAWALYQWQGARPWSYLCT